MTGEQVEESEGVLLKAQAAHDTNLIKMIQVRSAPAALVGMLSRSWTVTRDSGAGGGGQRQPRAGAGAGGVAEAGEDLGAGGAGGRPLLHAAGGLQDQRADRREVPPVLLAAPPSASFSRCGDTSKSSPRLERTSSDTGL